MPEIEDIETDIINYFERQNIELEAEENIFTSGLVDSIAMMQLIATLEKKYDYKTPSIDLVPNNFRTIRVTATYFYEKLSAP